MLKRKEQVVMTLTRGVEALFKKNKVTHYAGRGRFGGPGRVLVEHSGEPISLKAKSILIATGSKPALLPGIELKEGRIGTSTSFASLNRNRISSVRLGAVSIKQNVTPR